MRIYSHAYREECEVYVIAVAQRDDHPEKNVTFFVTDSNTFGLSVESLGSCEIIDSKIGSDFKYIYEPSINVSYICWNHFRDINHLGDLINLEPTVVDAFEKARKARELKNNHST